MWGLTTGVDEVPGYGPNGTVGDQPRFTTVKYNYAHELGIWEKQSSFFFQAQSAQTTLLGNMCVVMCVRVCAFFALLIYCIVAVPAVRLTALARL